MTILVIYLAIQFGPYIIKHDSMKRKSHKKVATVAEKAMEPSAKDFLSLRDQSLLSGEGKPHEKQSVYQLDLPLSKCPQNEGDFFQK